MALIVECISDEKSLSCCTGQSATANFKGLLLTDSGLEKRIYRPFDYYATGAGVYVADHRGNKHLITVADSSFSSVAEIQDFLSGCRAKRTAYNYIESFSGDTYTPPFTLASSERGRRVALYVGRVKQVYNVDWYVSGTDIKFYISAEGEPLEIFQD